MGFLSEMDDDLNEIEDDLGEMEDDGKRVLTWNGSNYPCAPTSLGVGSSTILGGYVESVVLSLRVRLRSMDTDLNIWDWTAVGSGPQNGELITFEGRDYEVSSWRKVHNRFVVLNCSDVHA